MKKISALCAVLAAAMLSGCSPSRIPTYSDMVDFPDLPSDVNSIISSASKPVSSETAPASSPKDQPDDPSAPLRELRYGTFSLCKDSDNERTLTIDGENLTVEVKNGDWITTSVHIGSAKFRSEEVGGKTRFTLDGSSIRKGYVNLELWDKGQTTTYRLRHDKEGFSFPNVLDVRDENAAAAASPTELTHTQTLIYITKDGSADNADAVLKKIKALSDKICRGLRGDYDKLRAISRWVSENIYYDHPAYKNGIPAECLTLEYMLERGSSVCGGYAAMTSALCEAQGIKCLHIKGSAITQGNSYAEADNGVHHEWNYAMIGNRGVWVDSGWNSQCHLYGTGEYSKGDIEYKYFDIGAEVFALNHKAISAQTRDYFPED